MGARVSLPNTIFDLVDRIHAATSIADTWDIYMGAAQDVGLAYGIACFYPHDQNIGQTTFASRLPEHWLQTYVSKNYQEIDPVLARTFWETKPFTWSLDEWDGVSDSRIKQWRDDKFAVGLTAGLAIPDRRDGRLKLIAVCGNTGSLAREEKLSLYYAGLETLAQMHQLGLRGGQQDTAPLSPRERECLNWLSAGKSDLDIGTILGISEKTVGTHIERVKQKLGVTTRAQAIVCALRRGDLSSPGPPSGKRNRA